MIMLAALHGAWATRHGHGGIKAWQLYMSKVDHLSLIQGSITIKVMYNVLY